MGLDQMGLCSPTLISLPFLPIMDQTKGGNCMDHGHQSVQPGDVVGRGEKGEKVNGKRGLMREK